MLIFCTITIKYLTYSYLLCKLLHWITFNNLHKCFINDLQKLFSSNLRPTVPFQEQVWVSAGWNNGRDYRLIMGVMKGWVVEKGLYHWSRKLSLREWEMVGDSFCCSNSTFGTPPFGTPITLTCSYPCLYEGTSMLYQLLTLWGCEAGASRSGLPLEKAKGSSLERKRPRLHV